MRLGLPRTVAALALGLWSAAAAAEPVRAVVEMYTSQGCAACRKADELLFDLGRRPGIVALTLPVTYWDYLGWRDSLASHAFTERQRSYASARSERPLMTPQAIISGGDAVVGNDRGGLESCLRRAQGAGLPVAVRTEEDEDRIVIDVDDDPAGRHADVWLVPVARIRPVAIERGENRGRAAVYVNVVRGMLRIGSWTGTAARYEVPREAAYRGGADAYVVMLQGAPNGRIDRVLGAAKGPGL